MPHYNVKPIHLVLQPSYLLAAILAAAGLGSCTIVACMPMAISLKILICVPVIAATIYFMLQDALLRLPWSLTAIDLNHKGELYVLDAHGTRYQASVLPGSFIAAYLTVLNFRMDGDDIGNALRRRNCLLLPQRVDDDAFRKLRVWLRWHSEKDT